MANTTNKLDRREKWSSIISNYGNMVALALTAIVVVYGVREYNQTQKLEQNRIAIELITEARSPEFLARFRRLMIVSEPLMSYSVDSLRGIFVGNPGIDTVKVSPEDSLLFLSYLSSCQAGQANHDLDSILRADSIRKQKFERMMVPVRDSIIFNFLVSWKAGYKDTALNALIKRDSLLNKKREQIMAIAQTVIEASKKAYPEDLERGSAEDFNVVFGVLDKVALLYNHEVSTEELLPKSIVGTIYSFEQIVERWPYADLDFQAIAISDYAPRSSEMEVLLEKIGNN